MKILVLLSTFNGQKYIQEQLDSIARQDIDATIDIMVRDDGSKDQTIEVLKQWKQSHSLHMDIYQEENVGVNKSFFTLINYAEHHDFYAFCDQDDIWLEDKLSSAISKIQDIQTPVLYGGCSYLWNLTEGKFGTTTKQEREITLLNTIVQNFLPGHAQVFNHELLKLLKNTPDIQNIYVYDAWVTNMAMTYGQIIFDNEPHTLYRQHENNVLGYAGKQGLLSWMKERLKRIKNDEAIRFAKQVQHFYSLHHQSMNEKERKEIYNFLNKQKNVFTRLHFILTTKMYRQNKVQTLLFKLLYLVGGYNI